MANTCINTIRIEGPQEDLLALRDHINAVRHDERFHNTRSLYLLLLRLGYSHEQALAMDIREDFNGGDATIDDQGVLTLDTESAWSFPASGWEAVRKKFPGVNIYYLAEELGNCLFETNDITGKHFRYRFCLDTWIDDEGNTEYFEDEESLIEHVRERYDATVRTLEQAKEALHEAESRSEDNCANLIPIHYNTEYNLFS